MKSFARLSLMGSGLGLIFLTAVPSFATVVGTLEYRRQRHGNGHPHRDHLHRERYCGRFHRSGVGTTLTYSGGRAANGWVNQSSSEAG